MGTFSSQRNRLQSPSTTNKNQWRSDLHLPLKSANQLCIDDWLTKKLISEISAFISFSKYKALDQDEKSFIQLSPNCHSPDHHSPEADGYEDQGDNSPILC